MTALAQAKEQPAVVTLLTQQLNAYTAKRFNGTLDVAVTSEDDYCAGIKQTGWVQPYEK